MGFVKEGLSEAFDGESEQVAKGEGASVAAGETGAEEGFVGRVDGQALVACALGLEPFEDPGVKEWSEGLHDIVGEGGGAFAGGMANAVERVEADGEEGLEGLCEEVGVGVVEEGVEAVVFGGGPSEGLEMEGLGAEIPVEVGAGAFFAGGGLDGEDADLGEGVGGAWGEGLGERELVGAFGVEGFEPKGVAEALGGFDLGAGEEGVDGTLDGEENGGGTEVLAENEGNPAGGDLGEEVAVEGTGGGRHEDGRDVLEGHLAVSVAYSAVELPVPAEGFRFFEPGDFNEVIGHAGIPVRR